MVRCHTGKMHRHRVCICVCTVLRSGHVSHATDHGCAHKMICIAE